MIPFKKISEKSRFLRPVNFRFGWLYVSVKIKKRLPILNEEMQFNDSLQSTHLFSGKTCKAKKYRKSVVRFIWELNKTLVGPFSNFYIVASKYI